MQRTENMGSGLNNNIVVLQKCILNTWRFGANFRKYFSAYIHAIADTVLSVLYLLLNVKVVETMCRLVTKNTFKYCKYVNNFPFHFHLPFIQCSNIFTPQIFSDFLYCIWFRFCGDIRIKSTQTPTPRYKDTRKEKKKSKEAKFKKKYLLVDSVYTDSSCIDLLHDLPLKETVSREKYEVLL